MKKGIVIAFVVLSIGLLACQVPTIPSSSQISGGIDIGANIKRFHDDELNVTCWKVRSEGITCIPDWQLEEPND